MMQAVPIYFKALAQLKWVSHLVQYLIPIRFKQAIREIAE